MRRALSIALGLFGTLGLFVFVFALSRSMSPSARAIAEQPRVLLPSLAPKEFAYVENPMAFEQWPSKYLFVRQEGGMLQVFEVPTANGRFSLPDQRWWRPGPKCEAFEPDFTLKQIRCKDSELPQWVKDNYRWSLEGKSLFPQVVENLIAVDGKIESGEFIFGAKHGA